MFGKEKKDFWVLVISVLFIVLNAIFTYHEVYVMNLIPIVFLIGFLAFASLDTLVMLIVFLTPFSIPLYLVESNFPFDMFLPSEPLTVGVSFLFFVKLIAERRFDRRIAYHPVSIAIYLYIFWLFITSLTSSMPLVSFKYLAARVWYITVFYALLSQIFYDYKNIKRFVWLFVASFVIVIGYASIHLLIVGLDQISTAHFVMQPFFKDHTVYGTVVAMFFMVLFVIAAKGHYSVNTKIILWGLVFYFLIALVLSYSRAAWLSVAGAMCLWIVFWLRIRLKFIVLSLLLGLVYVGANRTEIMLSLERNRQDSSTDIAEHVKSMSNVATDASNLERINRWMCALRMFSERPVFGWGPGTYTFQYAPFQISHEKTVISTNAGNLGNAHSEYIGPLAEQGLLGSINFLLIIIASFYTANNIYYRSKKHEVRFFALAFLLGLTTYYLHGVLNNFLEIDKAAIPFWGFTAAIVALEVYHSETLKPHNESKQ